MTDCNALARTIEAEGRRGANDWARFEDAPKPWQNRARERLVALLEAENGIEKTRAVEIQHWRHRVIGLQKRDWLPILIGDNHQKVNRFINRDENLSILDTIEGMINAIDAKIDRLLKEDDGECGYLRDQAGTYFALVESLRKARTEAKKLNEVEL